LKFALAIRNVTDRMNQPLTPLKKAAILIASLDDETADELLEQMGPEGAARVRREIMSLGAIDPDVERQVIAEFRRRDRPPRDPYPTGIELDSSLAEKLAQGDNADPIAPSNNPAAAEPAPFRFLHEAEADTLVQCLAHERPQTIAVVVSHLAPAQAAEVVDRLAPTLQAQVLRRLAELDEADPNVLRDVESHLETWISEQMRSRQRRRAGLDALGAILSAAGHSSRRQIVANLVHHDGSLAESLGLASTKRASTARAPSTGKNPETVARTPRQKELQFHDLLKLNNERLLALVTQASAEVVVLAMAGASAEFVDRVCACVPANKARLFRRALAHLGPTRLGDVEEAQQNLADLAADLEFDDRDQSTSRRMAAMAA
jgi:flagellar motor switch protein FliG